MTPVPLIRLQLLGPVRVTPAGVADGPSLLSQPRRLGLLAYLALARPRGFHSRESLTALLWPEAGQEDGRHALRNALHGIRKALGAPVIVTEGDWLVALDRGLVACDALELERAATDGGGAGVTDGYGRLMEGFHISDAWPFGEWLELERRRFDDLAVGALRLLSESRERQGDDEGALDAARRCCELAPYDERALRRLVALLDRRGDGAAAVAAYRSFTERVQRELGVAPSPEVEALARTVRVHRSPALPDSACYVQYVRGTYLVLRAAHGGHNDDLAASRVHFESALAHDPDFAPAVAGLASYYAVAAARGVLRPFEEAFGQAIALSRRALERDDRLAIPHVHLGVQAMYLDGDWERAGREFAQAVALDPGYAEAHRFLGIWYDAMERPSEALAELREAVRCEPHIAMFRNSLASALMDRGEWEEALRELERAREIDPAYGAARERIVRCAEELGRFDVALAERERAPAIGPVERLRAALAAGGADAYRRIVEEELRGQIAALAERAREWPPANPADRFNPPALRLAKICERLGEPDAAREWQEMACRMRPSLRPWFSRR